MAKTDSKLTVEELKLKIIDARAKIAAGREKNVKLAKNLRRELVRQLSKPVVVQETKEVKK